MMEKKLAKALTDAVKALYGQELSPDTFQIQKTRPEFEGDVTVVVFPLLRISRKAPEATARELGEQLTNAMEEVTGFNVIKGFLNLEISDSYWFSFFRRAAADEKFGFAPENEEPPVVIEYSSPNTNKPLHLGHVRNNLLGWSVAE
ncbi:MAG TPA: arginine--tRNA ligase, partial [Bacteroidetes bacterium]|nr:arginine--tRNA ligase [Bacteroidota bacterium]